MNTLVKIGASPLAVRAPSLRQRSMEAANPASRRYLSIDIMRAVAILLMVQVHFTEYLSAERPSPQLLSDLSGIFGLIPAPFFTFLSGLSFSLWLDSQRRAGRSSEHIAKYGYRRGMFVFVLGFAVNIFIWMPAQTFIWDILTLLGAAAIIMTALRNWRPGVIICICVVVLLVSPPLRDLSHYESSWFEDTYIHTSTLPDVVAGFLLNGYFPMLPWIIYPLVGFAVGQHYLVSRDSDEEAVSVPLMVPMWAAIMIGLALAGMLFEAHVPEWMSRYYANELPDDFYPASTVFVLGSLGLTLLCLWVLNYAIDMNHRITGKGRVLAFFRLYSQFALTVYVVHLAAHIWPMWIAATWQHQASLQYYVGTAMNTGMAFGLAVAFIVLFYPCLIVFQHYRKYSLEHMMRWFCE